MSLARLVSLGFQKVGSIQEQDRLRFQLAEDYASAQGSQGKVRGWIYAWVQGQAVHYIGRAGQTLRKRFREHEGGFVHGVTGQENASLLRAALTNGPVEVYARVSDQVEVFGELVSRAPVEETALVQIALREGWPIWNRELFNQKLTKT